MTAKKKPRKRVRAAAAVAPAAPTPKQVDVSLTGGFFHGWVTVNGTKIPLGPDGKGRATVILTPPVSVAIGMDASGPTTYALGTTINGCTKSESDTIDGGTTSHTFTYPASDFNL